MILLIVYLIGVGLTTIQLVKEESLEPEWVKIVVSAIIIPLWPIAWIIVAIHNIRR